MYAYTHKAMCCVEKAALCANVKGECGGIVCLYRTSVLCLCAYGITVCIYKAAVRIEGVCVQIVTVLLKGVVVFVCI